MSPERASFIVPISVFFIVFSAMYINIRIAKSKMREWKKFSTVAFFRSLGLGGRKRRASLVWVKEFGYDEADALILAKYQSRAIFEAFVGGSIFMIIAASNITR